MLQIIKNANVLNQQGELERKTIIIDEGKIKKIAGLEDQAVLDAEKSAQSVTDASGKTGHSGIDRYACGICVNLDSNTKRRSRQASVQQHKVVLQQSLACRTQDQ